MLHKDTLLKEYASKFINISLTIARESVFPAANTVVDRFHPKLVLGEHKFQINREEDATIGCDLVFPDGTDHECVSDYEESLRLSIKYAQGRFPKTLADLNELFEFTPVMRDVNDNNVEDVIQLAWQFALFMIKADVQRAWDNPSIIDEDK